jgi:biotin carboxyl carrier protein
MNRWIVRAAFAAVLTGTGFSPANAAEGATEALLACADEPDDARRLRCFDAAVADLRRAPAVAAASAAATTATATPATATPATATTATAAPAASPPPAAPAATAVGAKPYGELVVTLDNGQVWAELAPGSKVKVKAGDSVKIEAAALGSFFLIAPNGRSSKVARVR